jgi:hypothetical protein
MSFFGTTDFMLEVAKGNVPGHTAKFIIGRNTDVGTTYENVSGAGAAGVDAFPVAAETWEIISDSLNDAAAGTGAQAIFIVSLDENYEEQGQVVILDGTNAVTLTGTHIRSDQSTVIAAGSLGFNEGTLTIRDASSTDTRSTVLPEISESQDGRVTVPAGKTGYLFDINPWFPKNEDGAVQTKIKPEGADSAIITSLTFPFYQNAFNIPITAKTQIPEKTDGWFDAKSTNIGAEVIVTSSFLLVDN